MKLIVGLGNYPEEYKFTRHNAGFLTIDKFCEKNKIKLTKESFKGLYEKVNDEYIIAKPLTLMNLSGNFVHDIMKFYKIKAVDVLVICDDVDTDLGQMRIRKQGSSGGQKGLKDIITKVRSENIARIRIGIGKNVKYISLADHVLSKLTPAELKTLDPIFIKCVGAIESFISGTDIEKIMSEYNQ
jgi:PTH1 family peptidyl-tRNA hydrolase